MGKAGSGEPWGVHPDAGMGAPTPRSSALSPGYLSYLKKKAVRSDASSMTVIFVECVIIIPNSCFFF